MQPFIFPKRPTAFDSLLRAAFTVSLVVLGTPIGGAVVQDTPPPATPVPVHRGSFAEYEREFPQAG